MSNEKLTVLIIGGGIGGLVAAISLAQDGHDVTVIEHKSRYDSDGGESGQGLCLTVNATKCLFALGLEEDFLSIADVGQDLQIRNFQDGSSVRRVKTLNGHSMVHRSDLLRLLVRHATRADAKIHINQRCLGMIEHESGVGVMLQDGRVIQADVVIGADGIHSETRGYIEGVKSIEPVLTEHCTFLVDVPKVAMEKHEASEQLYECGRDPFQFWMAPERSIVAWTMTRHDRYHLQMNDHKYGNGSAYGAEQGNSKSLIAGYENLEAFRKRWSDFEPAVTELLGETTTVTRWRIAELPDLPTWSSSGGRIILLGDAAHAVPPYAGQGAAMAIEDASVLSVLLSNSEVFSEFGAVAKAYEKLRRPRIEGFRHIINDNMRRWSRTDAAAQQSILNASGSAGADDVTGAWATEKRYHWIDDYYARGTALEHVAELRK
ncbi:hypothetical protein CKM354_000416300 [Cercospora kikuchii]|uniref:FAD-binding domain-containing protein n=1 Tax=Cercospora kikuchii TaxID=84275 RepID=A0A9P3CJC0_9PEZI|nr:uncharacterized protein CKM354_000416300 [Cercospora kikuchii]GIZ40840.1 hypothetical protein CKM354_000416300 [Cercospora kikuchii]